MSNNENKYKYLFKNMTIFTISNFSSKLLSFFLVPIYTNILSTAEYGSYDIIMTTISLAIPILTLNVFDSVVRFSMDPKENKKSIATIGLQNILIASVLSVVIVVLNAIFKITDFTKGFEVVIVLYYIINILHQYLSSFAKGLERVFDIGVAGVVSTFSTILFNILFLVIMRLGLISFFLANILGLLLPCIFFVIRLKMWEFIDFKNIDNDLRKRMFAYCIPLIVTALSWIINDSLDKYVVTFAIGVSATGLISIAYKIPTILNVVQNIFTQAWQISAISEKDGKNTNEFYANTFIYVNIVMSMCCAFLILLCRPLSSFLYSKEFYNAWRYVPALLISSLFNTCAGLLGPLLSVKKDSKTLALSAICGSIANLVFNIVLVNMMGIQGAAVATALSSFIIYLVRKINCNDMLTDYINRITYSTWGLLIVQAVSEVWLQNYLIQIVAIALILFINRNYIVEIIKMVFDIVFKKFIHTKQ